MINFSAISYVQSGCWSKISWEQLLQAKHTLIDWSSSAFHACLRFKTHSTCPSPTHFAHAVTYFKLIWNLHDHCAHCADYWWAKANEIAKQSKGEKQCKGGAKSRKLILMFPQPVFDPSFSSVSSILCKKTLSLCWH